MTAAAVAAARAAGYRNAGTVEFLVDLSGGESAAPFYFLEMNTRLQVEHSGHRSRSPASISCARSCSSRRASRCRGARTASRQRGHAIEARVYAEDPARGFLPQAGRLLLYREPRLPGVRVDSGVAEGERRVRCTTIRCSPR